MDDAVDLRSLEVRNFRSLEHVTLDGLGQFNVLIGRNNAGKSSVLVALQAVNYRVNGANFNWQRVLTDQDASRALQVRILFDVTDEERELFVDALVAESSMPP